VFAWQPSDITGVPKRVIRRTLNVNMSIHPVAQKQRFLGTEKSRAVIKEVEEWIKAGILGRNLEAYVDDIVIKSKTEHEMIMDIAETFNNLRRINMKLNPKKYSFGIEEGKFLVYMVTSKGIRETPKKTKVVADMQSPKTLKEMQSLSGKLAALNKFLASIPCSPECKIMGHILLDHPLSYALTTTADVSAVYLQQFWKTVSKVPDTKDTIKFKLDRQKIVYTVDMFRDNLHLPVETPDNPFIAPVNIKVIESFMQKVGYQGIVDKKKDVIQYPRFTKLIIANLMKKFPSIPQRLDEDYHSIKDDIPLVSVYSTRNVLFRGMLILDAFLTDEIRATDDYAEYKTVFVKFAASMLNDDVDDSGNRLEPGSHKENPEHVDDDDENEKEKKHEKKDDVEDKDNADHTDHALVGTQEMGSLEIRKEQTQTPIPTPSRSPRINLSLDKKIVQELTDTASPSTATTSKDPYKKRRISSKYNHLSRALSQDVQTSRIYDQGYGKKMCDNWQILEIHPTTSSSTATTSSADLQQQLYLKMKSNIQDQANDLTLWDVLKRKFKKSSTLPHSCRDDAFHSRHHDDHNDDDAPPGGRKERKDTRHPKVKSLIGVLRQNNHPKNPYLMYPSNNRNEVHGLRKQLLMKMRMEATLNDMMNNQFINAEEYAYHLEQSTNFIKNQIVWESRQEDIRRSKPKALNGNTEEKKYILSLHKIHAVPFPEFDLEEKMNRWVQKEFKTFNEEARLSIQYWKDSWHKRVYKQNQRKVRDNPEDYFSNNKITKVVRITIDQLYGLNFMEQIIVMRENVKPDSFFEADFKSRVIWERVHDFQLGIESYHIKVNLTAPTLTFPGIEVHDMYSIVDKPDTGLIYLNNKDEKRVMYLVEIVKFCDATLKKVLKEVKLRIFQNEFWKKPHLLGELDPDIMKTYEREITKR
ncbi:hypothetical protein Tco_0110257, partial [Tanacetum coccineum]